MRPSKSIYIKLQEQFQNLEKVLKEVSVIDKETSTASTQESAQILIEQEAEKVKAAILETWNNKLISRSKHFWQKVRNEHIAKVYENWRNTTPIVIPRKLQIKEIIEEPDNQRRLRERRVLDMYRSEKELLENIKDSANLRQALCSSFVFVLRSLSVVQQFQYYCIVCFST